MEPKRLQVNRDGHTESRVGKISLWDFPGKHPPSPKRNLLEPLPSSNPYHWSPPPTPGTPDPEPDPIGVEDQRKVVSVTQKTRRRDIGPFPHSTKEGPCRRQTTEKEEYGTGPRKRTETKIHVDTLTPCVPYHLRGSRTTSVGPVGSGVFLLLLHSRTNYEGDFG